MGAWLVWGVSSLEAVSLARGFSLVVSGFYGFPGYLLTILVIHGGSIDYTHLRQHFLLPSLYFFKLTHLINFGISKIYTPFWKLC